MIDGRERDDPAEAAAPRVPASGDDQAAAAAREREAQLIRRARDGQAEAWGRLYHDHYDRLLRDLTYLASDVAIAEDLVKLNDRKGGDMDESRQRRRDRRGPGPRVIPPRAHLPRALRRALVVRRLDPRDRPQPHPPALALGLAAAPRP
jgi:hypothetical protein